MFCGMTPGQARFHQTGIPTDQPTKRPRMVSFVDFAPAEPQKGRAVACLIGLFKDG